MTWIIVSIWIAALTLNIYCSVLYYKIYNKGLTNITGRISLNKLNRALNNAKEEDLKDEIKLVKQFYIAFLSLFYVGVVGAVIQVIRASN